VLVNYNTIFLNLQAVVGDVLGQLKALAHTETKLPYPCELPGKNITNTAPVNEFLFRIVVTAMHLRHPQPLPFPASTGIIFGSSNT
jgi:hypothetical protein